MRLLDNLFVKKKEMEEISYMEKMGKYCVIYLILLFLLFSFGAASAKTITVDDSGGADFTKIHDAVNVACAGDTIIVKDGTYAEDVRVNKSLTIQSENGTDKTIVESPGLKFNITADEVEIVGFTITGVESLDNAGIKLHNVSGCEITDNNIINNYKSVALISSSNNRFVNNTLIGGADGYGWGVILISSSNNYIINNTIAGNKYGLALHCSHHNFICFNDFANSLDVPLSRNNYWNSPYKVKYIYKNKEIENYVGNHWVFYDYMQDENEDGVCDYPHCSDLYPLKEPKCNYNLQSDLIQKSVFNFLTSEEKHTKEVMAKEAAAKVGFLILLGVIFLSSLCFLYFFSRAILNTSKSIDEGVNLEKSPQIEKTNIDKAVVKKKGITEAITVILLAVVTINTFIDFLPRYVAIAFELLILWNLFYEYQPKITRGLYGTFAEQRSARLYLMFCAIPGYIIVLTPNFGLFLLVMVVTISFALSFSLNNDYHEANKGIEVPEQTFYKINCKFFGEDPVKWWERYKNLPESTSKEIYKLFWWINPGLYLWLLGIVVFCIFWLISVYSQLFAIILAGWVLGWLLNRISIKSKWLSKKKPNLERELLDIASFIRSPKEICSALLFFTALLIPGLYLFFLQSTYVTKSPLGYIYLLLLLPPFIYQFIFWYAMLRRFPSFFFCWKNGLSRSKSFSLPTGGLYAFIVSCVYSYIFFHFFENVSQLRELTFLLLLSVISFIYIGLILHTVKKWRKKEIIDDICRDNFRIPLAFSIQVMSFLPFYMFSIRYPIPDASFSLYLILHLSLVIVYLIVFFIADWLRFLDNRYPSHPLTPLRAYILFLLPFFGLVLLGNFIMSALWEEGSMFLNFFSLLSIVVVFVLLLATVSQISVNRLRRLNKKDVAVTKRPVDKKDEIVTKRHIIRIITQYDPITVKDVKNMVATEGIIMSCFCIFVEIILVSFALLASVPGFYGLVLTLIIVACIVSYFFVIVSGFLLIKLKGSINEGNAEDIRTIISSDYPLFTHWDIIKRLCQANKCFFYHVLLLGIGCIIMAISCIMAIGLILIVPDII